MFEALFILTTVDTRTRVARFLLQEIGSNVYKPLSKTGWLPGNIVASFFVVSAWGYLIYSGNISTIWPMFGVANQLLAAIALGVGTAVIVKSGRWRYAWTTFIPMLFMFTTTLTASWKLIEIFRDKALSAVSRTEALTFKIDALLVLIMATLAIIVLLDMLYKLHCYISGRLDIVKKGI